MLCFPRLHVIQGHDIVGILRDLIVDVQHDEPEQELARIDLVDRLQALVKMGWRVDVRPPLPGVREDFDRETVLIDGIRRLDRFGLDPFPMRNVRPERVREIDEVRLLNGLEGVLEWRRLRQIGTRVAVAAAERDDQPDRSGQE